MGKYQELTESFYEDYEQPVIEDYIVGFSGLDPDRKIKPETIDHEKLDGLLGGDFSGRYHLTNDEVRKFTGYQEQINQEIQDRQSAISTLRSDTDSAVTTLRSDTDKAVTTLRSETNQAISTLRSDSETSDREIRKEAQTSVRDLKAEKDREIQTLNADIAEAKTAMAGQVSEISERQEALEETQADINVRFDEALEGLTEDSEVIDARVDAENTRHVNLGANVRNIHRLLIHAGEDIRYQAQEFQGLLQQYGELVLAQIRGELNWQEANERRKSEIQQEALTRRDNEASIQGQIDTLAQTEIEDALLRKRDCEKFREKIEKETQSRNDADYHERLQRAEKDEALKEEIDDLSNAILASVFNFLEDIDRVENEIRQEASSRNENDGVLQEQINELSKAVLKSALNLEQSIERRKNEINRGLQKLSKSDDDKQSQIDYGQETSSALQEQVQQLALSVLRWNVNHSRERQHSRETTGTLKGQISDWERKSAEAEKRLFDVMSEISAQAAQRASENAAAILSTALQLVKARETQRKNQALIREEIKNRSQRIYDWINAVQEQINELASLKLSDLKASYEMNVRLSVIESELDPDGTATDDEADEAIDDAFSTETAIEVEPEFEEVADEIFGVNP